MPKTKSAKKALRQGLRRRAQNRAKKSALRSAIKAHYRAATGGKKEDANRMLPALYKLLDKTAKTHVISKNRASRTKSRLAKTLQRTP